MPGRPPDGDGYRVPHRIPARSTASTCCAREYRVVWQQKPFAYNPARVVYVIAKTARDAETLVYDHVERKQGLARSEFMVRGVDEAQPRPPGSVKD